MKNTFFKIFAAVILFANINVFAWGTNGHRIVAEIAERHLTPAAKLGIQKIIGSQKLAYWANWADFIKSDTTGVWKPASEWHYLDLSFNKDKTVFLDSLRNAKGPNLYTQIQALSAAVKNPATQPNDRELDLRFLIHLMGDLSQPLHVGHAEDKGGNDIKLNYFGASTNLHALWDDKLLDSQKYSYTEYADVLDSQPGTDVAAIQGGTLEDWFYDSSQMAEKIYAGSIAGTNYSFDYGYKYHDLLERQLLYGGLRLAKVLSDIFS